jgi:hypothetical protein
VRLGTGLVGTIAALVLGLLIASAKTSYDAQSSQLQRITADVILLDGSWRCMGPKRVWLAAPCGRNWPMVEGLWSDKNSDRVTGE